MTVDLRREGRASIGFRCLVRVGAASVVAIGCVLGVKNLSITQPVISPLLAYGFALLSMIVHLNVTGLLSRQEKAAWRSKLWTSSGVILALLTYLSSRELRDGAHDLATSNHEAQ